jgi:hypothetical protein
MRAPVYTVRTALAGACPVPGDRASVARIMPIRHTVAAGECLESIAFQYGFFAATVWDHPENQALRATRDSAVLRPGDIVFVPDLRTKEGPCATGARHVFRRRGVPSRFRVQIVDRDDGAGATGRPRAGVHYRVVFDGGVAELRGTTDSQGRIDHPMSPDAHVAEVFIGDDVLHFDLGRLDPVDEEGSLVARLHGLGYLEDTEEASGARLANALRSFQRAAGLDPSGAADGATRAALVREYGC